MLLMHHNTSAAYPLRNALRAHWSLNEATGTRLDSHTHGLDLTDNNGVTGATGVVGNASQFTALSSQYLSLADTPLLEFGGNDFSVAGWVYLDTTGFLPLWGKHNVTTEFTLYFRMDTGRFRFVFNDGTTQTELDNTEVILMSNWYFVHTYRSGGELGISINAGARATTSISGSMPATASEFQLGRFGNTYMNGRMNAISVFSSALTTTHEAWLFNSSMGRTYAEIVAHKE